MSEKNTEVPDFMKATPDEDLFTDPSTEPKSDWMKFVTPGDAIQGKLLEVQYDVPSKFGPQTVYTLETTEGDVVFVGLNPKSHVRATRQAKQADLGDILGFKFESEYDSGKGNPGKNISVRIKHMPKA